MAIYSQVSPLPIIFQVGAGKIGELSEILENKHLRFRSVLLVSGGTYSCEVAKKIVLSQVARHEMVAANSIEEVERISRLLDSQRFDLIIGIGGGTVLDIVKRVALLRRINHLSVPTVISSDGLISPISVLRDRTGATESLPGSMPMGVVVDLNIIAASPRKYIQAAAGDLLSNMSATNDWLIANERSGEPVNDIAFQLSRMAAHSVINFKHVDLDSMAFLKMIIQGQVNSGISMALAGTSRPCSGSEHLISHAIDAMGLSSGTLHGYQVGALSLFCLYLQRKLKQVHVEYAKTLGLPLDFLNFTGLDWAVWKNLFLKARSMRPGRVTVLDYFSEEDLYDEYRRYRDFAAKFDSSVAVVSTES